MVTPTCSTMGELPGPSLFIDSDGIVVDTQVLQSAEAPDVIESVRRMFLSTSFTAGLVKGQPVPSFKDIELNVDARS